jgi:hypothetical protein
VESWTELVEYAKFAKIVNAGLTNGAFPISCVKESSLKSLDSDENHSLCNQCHTALQIHKFTLRIVALQRSVYMRSFAFQLSLRNLLIIFTI